MNVGLARMRFEAALDRLMDDMDGLIRDGSIAESDANVVFDEYELGDLWIEWKENQ